MCRRIEDECNPDRIDERNRRWEDLLQSWHENRLIP